MMKKTVVRIQNVFVGQNNMLHRPHTTGLFQVTLERQQMNEVNEGRKRKKPCGNISLEKCKTESMGNGKKIIDMGRSERRRRKK